MFKVENKDTKTTPQPLENLKGYDLFKQIDFIFNICTTFMGLKNRPAPIKPDIKPDVSFRLKCLVNRKYT